MKLFLGFEAARHGECSLKLAVTGGKVSSWNAGGFPRYFRAELGKLEWEDTKCCSASTSAVSASCSGAMTACPTPRSSVSSL